MGQVWGEPLGGTDEARTRQERNIRPTVAKTRHHAEMDPVNYAEEMCDGETARITRNRPFDSPIWLFAGWRSRRLCLSLGQARALHLLRCPICRQVLFGSFDGRMGLSGFLSACVADVRCPNCSGARRSLTGRRAWDLPVLVHGASTHSQGLRLRGVGFANSNNATDRLAFSINQQGRHPRRVISELST